jgi:hypothetical protein
MLTLEIPARDWSRVLDEFSSVHEGWLVSLDLKAPAIGAQREISRLPLVGVTAESGANDPTITIAAARRDGEHISHIIHAPTHVRLERTTDGADVALEVESADGTAAVLRFGNAIHPGDRGDGTGR